MRQKDARGVRFPSAAYTKNMKISPLVLAIRAVAAEFAQRIFMPIVYIGSGILVVCLGISIWLVTINGWWWILLGFFILLSLAFAFAMTVAGLIITLLKPRQTKAQRRDVGTFVDSLQGAAEILQTPKSFVFFRLVKDVLFPNKESFVHQVSNHASSLRSGFRSIIDSFQ